jgi:hypothetical protein
MENFMTAMRLVFLSLCFVFCIQTRFFAQVKPISEKEIYNYNFEKTSGIFQNLLEKLAKANEKSTILMQFGFTFEKTLNLDGSQKSVKSVIKASDFKGDFRYKGFSVAHLLLPKYISYKVLESSNIIQEFAKSELISEQYLEKFALLEGAHKYKFSKIDFIYDESQSKEMDLNFELINNYPSLKNEIAALDAEISTVNFSDPTKIFDNENKIRNFESKLVKFVRYNQELNLSDYDPDNFRAAYNKLSNKLEHAKEAFENSAKDIHLIFYRKGLELMEDGKSNTAILYFSQAANRRPDFAAPHVQLARIAYTNGDFDLVENELMRAINSAELDAESREFAVALFTDMFWYYLKSGDTYINNLNFKDAFLEYEKADKILDRKIVPVENRDELNQRTQKARNDQFEYMLSEARFKIFQNHLDEAYKELLVTHDFAKKHYQFINDTAQIKEVYQFLFEKAVEYAEQYNVNKSYVKSVSELKTAENVLSYNSNPAFLSRYRKAIYDANLGLASKMLENDKMSNAIEYLHAAELAIALEPNSINLVSELKKRKKALLDKWFSLRIEQSKTENEEQKRKTSKDLIQLVIKYGYSPTAEMKEAYNKLVQEFGN